MRRNTPTCLAGIVCAVGILFLGSDRLCHGGGLLQFQFDPDGPTISAANASLNYDASTGEFSGGAVPLTLSSTLLPGSGVASFSSDSQLSFDFFVNPDGSFRSDPDGFNLTGTLSIGETRISGTLLSGDFYNFGAEPEGPPTWMANALMNPTGGELTQPQALPDGSTLPTLFPTYTAVGMDFFVDGVTGGTLGDFTRSFRSDEVQLQVGAASVPEPSGGMLAIIAIVVLGLFGFTRKRQVVGSDALPGTGRTGALDPAPQPSG